MNSGMWGIGFALVDMPNAKRLRFVGTPMRRSDFLLALPPVAGSLLVEIRPAAVWVCWPLTCEFWARYSRLLPNYGRRRIFGVWTAHGSRAQR